MIKPKKPLYFIYIAFISCLFTVFTPHSAFAAGICDISGNTSGIGGTGFTQRSGLGGTGAPQHHGIGGTGKPLTNKSDRGNGIGGTGQRAGVVIGTITGFGSICVNGIEIHYSSSTPLQSEGQRLSVDQLAIGQVVAVSVSGTGKEVTANQMHILHAVTGPVSSLDFVKGKMTVLGQTVNLAMNSSILNPSTIKPGNMVAVSGLRDMNGHIVASRIDPLPTKNTVSIHGKVTHATSNSFTVHGTQVRAPLPLNISPGSMVTVTGQLVGNAIKPERIEPAEEQTLPADIGGLVSVESYFAPTQKGYSIEVAGKVIDIPEKLESELKQLDKPQKVIITGQLETDHHIQATELIIVPPEHEQYKNDDGFERISKKNKSNKIQDSEKSHIGFESEHEAKHESDKTKPEYSEFGKSEHSKFEKPERPEFEKPERPEFEKPERPEFEKPERPEFE